MHPSALSLGKNFFDTYFNDDSKIVEIGSQDVNGSLRELLPVNVKYTGVDFVAGKNVDVVLEEPYKLPFENESADIVVCSSCLEHSDFFWVTFMEMLRILKPSGVCYINVPSNGYVHRYPVDSWRFYPDAGVSLAKWANVNGVNTSVLESFIAHRFLDKGKYLEDSLIWNDFVAVLIKDASFAYRYKSRICRKIPGSISNLIIDDQIVPRYKRYKPQDLSYIERLKKEQEELTSELLNKDKMIKELEKKLKSVDSA